MSNISMQSDVVKPAATCISILTSNAAPIAIKDFLAMILKCQHISSFSIFSNE